MLGQIYQNFDCYYLLCMNLNKWEVYGDFFLVNMINFVANKIIKIKNISYLILISFDISVNNSHSTFCITNYFFGYTPQ